MPSTLQTGHVDNEVLADYLHGQLSEVRAVAVERHLADCRECTEFVRLLRAAGLILQDWTAESHGRAYRQSLLAEALQGEEARTPSAEIRRRLGHWHQQIISAGVDAIRNIQAVLRADSVWELAVATVPVRTRGGRRKAAPRGRGGAGRRRAQVEIGSGIMLAFVEVREASGVIEVSVRATAQNPPLVVVIPIDDSGRALVKKPSWQPDARRAVARFEALASGGYIIAIEPAQSNAPGT